MLKTRAALEYTYYHKHEALIHGDLHTGSIMLNHEHTYFIDPEFARIGPISFDLGMLIANLIISALAAEYHLRETIEDKNKFQNWIIQSTQSIYDEGIAKLTAAGINHEELKAETLGYCAIEIIRRTIGAAQLKDFLSIHDIAWRAKLERAALSIAVQQLTDHAAKNSITHTLKLLKIALGK